MRIAFPTNNGETVEEHFGHSRQFALCTIEEGVEWNREILTAPAHTPGAFPRFLKEKGADVIITGGMGQRAISLFEEANIEVILGAGGKIEDAIKQFLAGELKSTGSSCNHNHDHECHNN